MFFFFKVPKKAFMPQQHKCGCACDVCQIEHSCSLCETRVPKHLIAIKPSTNQFYIIKSISIGIEPIHKPYLYEFILRRIQETEDAKIWDYVISKEEVADDPLYVDKKEV